MLLIIFLFLLVGCVIVLWIGSVLLQGWLYNDLASKLPVRALVGGFIVAGLLVGWCAVYQKDPGRFDTLLNFSREKLDGTYDEMYSIRKVGDKEQEAVRYTRKAGGRGTAEEFISTKTNKPWKRSDAEGMVVAVLIKENDNAEKTRFDAKLEPNGKFPATGLRYVQAKENRYMDEASLGQIYRVRSWAIVGNFCANGLHLGVWILVLMFVMRFTPGHAVAIGLVLWGITMIVVQPVLFGQVLKS